MSAEEFTEPLRSCPAPDVAVIVATRNRRPLLAQAVASVLSQQGCTLELLIVDDCSTDDTLLWLNSIDDRRLRTLPLPEHRERSAARNFGLAASCAPWALFLDDDDLLPSGALAVLSAAASAADADVAAVAGQRVIFDSDGVTATQSSLNRRVRRRREGPLWAELDACPDLVGGMVLFRTSATRAVGGFDETLTFSEDHHLLWRLAAQGWHWIVLPARTLLSRTHAGQEAYPIGSERAARTAAVEVQRNHCALLGPVPDRRVTGWRHVRQARLASAGGPRVDVLRETVCAVRADPTLVKSSLFRLEALQIIAKAALPAWAVRAIHRVTVRSRP